MKKPLFYRLFKLGKLPKNIDPNKLAIWDEGIKIVATYKDFKSTGKRFKSKKTIMVGSIMCTENRILAFAYSKPLLNLELTDERLQQVDYSKCTDNEFNMKFDVSVFTENATGDVSYNFHTSKAKEILARIKK